MKKIISILIILLSFSVLAQKTDDPFDMVNSLYGLKEKGEVDKAIEVSIKLNEIDQSLLIGNIHHSLSQKLLRNKGVGNSSDYLNKLYAKKNTAINSFIEPIYLWNKSYKVKTEKEANTLLANYYKKLADSSNHKSKAELYGLLMVNVFNFKEIGKDELKDKLINKIKSNAESYPLIDKPSDNRRINEKRAWNRCILAYSNNILFNKHFEEIYIESAAKYSPDQIDLQNKSAYFYDVALLTGSPENSDYKRKYFDYLIKKGKSEKALNTLLKETLVQATNANLNRLRDFYNSLNKENTFRSFWYNYLNSNMKDVPKIKITYKSGVLNLTKTHDNWVYIDVWGTWCSPCIKELPEFNKVAKAYNDKVSSKIKFYTFSYGSKGLDAFMAKNNYTFPVAEIDKNINDAFNVVGYPTKILISPDNKYLKIPFGVNWVEYMKNYALVN